MSEYYPKISERQTDELIEIANSSTEVWQQDAINQAKFELIKRNITEKQQNAFFEQIEAFITYLNESCYVGITGYEFHYALYESGSFYKKHLDQFKNNTDRKYSMITYLNSDWQASDGGELFIHQKDNNLKIPPTQGKTVFFKSDELEHEVLPTQKVRMSITGWLKGS